MMYLDRRLRESEAMILESWVSPCLPFDDCRLRLSASGSTLLNHTVVVEWFAIESMDSNNVAERGPSE
jgi:hypothetical protein